MNSNQTRAAETYIKRIRNPRKRAFARLYWDWMKNGEVGDSPKHNLTPMGAQAVWLNDSTTEAA